MATRLTDEFPARTKAPTAAYPDGSYLNESAPGANDGTPLDERIGDDYEGLKQSLLAKAGITPNGQPDSVTNPQQLSAIEKFDNDRQKETTGLSDITEASIGLDIFPLIGQGLRVAGVGLWFVPSITADGSPMPNPANLDSVPTGPNVTVNGGTAVKLVQVEIMGGSVDSFSSKTFPIGAVVKCSFYNASESPVMGLKYIVESPSSADGFVNHNDASGNLLRLINNGKITVDQAGGVIGNDVTDNIKAALDEVSTVILGDTGSSEYFYRPDEIQINEGKAIEGISKSRTILTNNSTTGGGLILRGSYGALRNLFIRSNDDAFTGSLVTWQNNGFNVYQQIIEDCQFRCGSSATVGTAINVFVPGTSGDPVVGCIQPIMRNVQFWRCKDAVKLGVEELGVGFMDVGHFQDLRFSQCENWINHETKGINRMLYENCVGAYDGGTATGFIDRGVGNEYKNSFMFDYSFEYLYLTTDSEGAIVSSGTARGERSVNDKGYKTRFVDNKRTTNPTNPGGLGWFEYNDNCIGVDVENKWKVSSVGSSTADYLLNVSTLGPCLNLKTGGSASDSVECTLAPPNFIRSRAQSTISCIFVMTSSTVSDGDFLFRFGFRNPSTPASCTSNLLAQPSASPNFRFEILTSEASANIIDTGIPIDSEPHTVQITRSQKNANAMVVFLDGVSYATGATFDNDLDADPTIFIRNDGSTQKEILIHDIEMRTTSAIYSS